MKLIDDWKQVWKWYSTHAMVIYRIARKTSPFMARMDSATAKPSYNGVAADNQGSLRQGMPEVTPVEIRAAVAHSAQEPTEATMQERSPA